MKRRDLLRTVAAGTALGTAGAATASAQEDDGGPKRYIVGTDGPKGLAIARKKAADVNRHLDFGDIGDAVAGRFPEPAAEALASHPKVRYVELEGRMQALGESVPWGVDRIDADLAQADGYTGDGADVAVLDTGIDSDHPDLEANLGSGKSFVSCDSGSTSNTCHESWDDDDGHGTHCAGTVGAVDNSRDVVGVGSALTLHAVKVLGSDGWGYYSTIAAGIKHAADQGYEVASMSIGGSSSSSTMDDAIQYATDKGTLCVAAAGNDGPCSDCVMFPARHPDVVAVSATTSGDDLASFSCTGPEIELGAPGQYIESTVPGGTAYYSGTSMACPHVSGAAGVLMNNGYSNTEARDRLAKTAEDIGLGSNEQGNGLLDLESALANSDSSSGVGEIGSVSTNQPSPDEWHSVSLSNSYSDPVVVMKPVSFEGRQPAHVRLRNVGSDGFDFKIEEWAYMDGAHKQERVHYLVLEAGTHTLSDGTVVEAGTTQNNHQWKDIGFDQNFGSTPVVFSQCATWKGTSPVVSRQQNVSTNGFTMRLQEEEGLDDKHYTENVGYIAVEPGTGSAHTVGTTGAEVTHTWYDVTFPTSYSSAPMFLAQMQTTNGSHPGNVRYTNLSGDGVSVRIQEEQSADEETWHTTEDVGYFLISSEGILSTN